jgi:hypothetical protein
VHWHGRAALLRRLLADQQVSPTGLAFVPILIETAIHQRFPTNVIPFNSAPVFSGHVSFPDAHRLIWGQMIELANRMAIRVIIYAVYVVRALKLLFTWQRLNVLSQSGV